MKKYIGLVILMFVLIFVPGFVSKAQSLPVGCEPGYSYSPITGEPCVVSNNSPIPSVNGVTGPTQLKLNQQGTWVVNTSYKGTDALKYSVVWGDEGALNKSNSQSTFSQQVNMFTHTYTTLPPTVARGYCPANAYCPLFTVANSSGKSNSTSLSVDIVGTVPVQGPSVSLNENTNLKDQNISPNSTHVKIGSFVLKNDSTESVRVMTLKVGFSFSGFSVSNLANLSMYNATTGTQVGSTIVPTNTNNIFSIDNTIVAGSTVVFDVYSDFSSSLGYVVTSLDVTGTGITSNNSFDTGVVQGQQTNIMTTTLNNPTFVASLSTPSQNIVVGPNGLTDGSKATYNFRTTGSSVTITELKYFASGTHNSASSIRIGSVVAPFSNSVAYLTGLNLVVPTDQIPGGSNGLNLEAYISYPGVGNNGIASGATSQVQITYAKYTYGTITNSVNLTSTPSPAMTLVSTPVNTPSITVLSPNGGEIWAKGTTQTIKWQDNVTSVCPVGSICDPALRQFDIKLIRSNLCPPGAYCAPYIDGPYTIASKVSGYGSSRSFSWKVGEIKDVGKTVYDGTYNVQICSSTSNECDSSDNYFTITYPTTPVIYPAGCTSYVGYSDTTGLPCDGSMTGKATVTACSSGQQTVTDGPLGGYRSASDKGYFGRLLLDTSSHPEILKYKIKWFSGNWSDWYTPGVNDVDWKKHMDGSSRRVWSYFDDHTHLFVRTCTSDDNTPSITILSPNGGETYTAGQQVTVRWASSNIPANALIGISLQTASGSRQPLLPPSVSYSTINDGTETVTLPTATSLSSDGWVLGLNFKIEVGYSLNNANHDSINDASDNLFTITSSSVQKPDLIVSTPTQNTATAGSPFSFSTTVTNQGNVSIDRSFWVAFQTATAINGGGKITTALEALPKLAVGASANVSKSTTFATAGMSSARVCADFDSISTIINESNEDNNCSPWVNVTVVNANTPTLSVDLQKNNSYLDNTVYTNSKHVKIGSFVLKNNSTQDVRVNNFKIWFGGDSNGAVPRSDITNIGLYDSSGAQIGSTVFVPSSATETNVKGNTMVAVDTSKIFEVYADLGVSVGYVSTSLQASGVGIVSNTNFSTMTAVGQKISIVAPIASTGTVKVVTRVSGRAILESENGACVATVVSPAGNNTAGCVRTLTNAQLGTYSLKWNSGYPTAFNVDTTKAPTISPSATQTLSASSSTTFYLDFASKPLPTATISVVPTSGIVNVVNPRVTWGSTNASSCTMSGDGRNISGAIGGAMDQGVLTTVKTYTYTVTCSNAIGTSAPASATVVVTAAPVGGPSISVVSAPSTLNSGQQGTWVINVVDSTSNDLSYSYVWGDETGPKAPPRSASSQINSTTHTYINTTNTAKTYYPVFTVTNNSTGKSASTSATAYPVVVNGTQVSAPTVTLSANPTSIQAGQSSIITWSSTNATSCKLINVTNYSSYQIVEISGSRTTGALSAPNTYTVTCTGSGGTASQTVTVNILTPPPAGSVNIIPRLSGNTIPSSQLGSSCTTNLTTPSGSNIGSCSRTILNVANGTYSLKWLSGYPNVSGIDTTKAPTITPATAILSGSNSATFYVDFAGTTNTALPTVTLSANPTIVKNGGVPTFTWSSTNATSCAKSGYWEFQGGTETSGTILNGGNFGGLTSDSTFTITCTGPGGSTTKSVTVTVLKNNVLASAVTYTPTNVTVGVPVTFSFTITNIDNTTSGVLYPYFFVASAVNGTGTVNSFFNDYKYGLSPNTSVSSSATKTFSTAGTYSVQACADGYNKTTGSCSPWVNVAVTNVAQNPTPTATLTANPTSVAYGGSSTLSWSSTNATNGCTLSGMPMSTTGTQSTGTLTATKTYTLICTGVGGNSVSKSVTVTVTGTTTSLPDLIASVPTYTPTNNIYISNPVDFISNISNIGNAPADSGSFKAIPYIFQKSTLSNGGGVVSILLGHFYISSPVSVGATEVAAIRYSFTSAGTYSVRACADMLADGYYSSMVTESNETNNCSPWVNIVVKSGQIPTPTATISANPTSIQSGQSSTVSWSSTDASSCILNGNSVTSSGSISTGALTATKEYTIYCVGNGISPSQSVTVTVATTPAPTVTLSANPTSVQSGQSSTVSWSSTNSTSCTLNGTTVATSGSQSTGILTATKTYTVLCGTATANTTVIVTPAPVSLPDLTASTPTTTTATVGTPVTFNSTISNIGTGSTGTSFYYLFQKAAGPDGTGTVSDIGQSYLPIIAPGATGTASKSTTFTTAGAYSIRSCADKVATSGFDSYSYIKESNEDNNCSSWVNVTVSSPVVTVVKPDLVASTPTPTSIRAMTSVTFTSTITNQGNASTGTSFNTVLKISTTPQTDVNVVGGPNITMLSPVSIPAIAAGGVATFSESTTFGSAGTYYINVCADYATTSIDESNENNNCSPWTTVTVSPVAIIPTTSFTANALNALDNTNYNNVVVSQPTQGCGVFTLILSKGMDDPQVKCLQKLLIQKGFKVAGISEGGEIEHFGYNTLVALKAFQASIGLKADGILGPLTVQALVK